LFQKLLLPASYFALLVVVVAVAVAMTDSGLSTIDLPAGTQAP